MTRQVINQSRRDLLKVCSAISLTAIGSPPVFALRDGEPSLTARLSALQRAAHQVLERPLVFQDPLALKIIGDQGFGEIKTNLNYHREPTVRFLRAALVARSRFTEDELSAAYARGIRQYIVLGAGLDTFAYRNPYHDLSVFEVDDYVTQLWKRKALEDSRIEIPGTLQFVSVDFERQVLGDRLREAGFQFDRPVFVSWLGVTMYLTPEAVLSTLAMIANQCIKDSAVVFDYLLPAGELSYSENISRTLFSMEMARIGEPWISQFNSAELGASLRRMGYSSMQFIGPDQINVRYFSNRSDGFMVRGSSRLLHAKI